MIKTFNASATLLLNDKVERAPWVLAVLLLALADLVYWRKLTRDTKHELGSLLIGQEKPRDHFQKIWPGNLVWTE